MKCFFCPVSFFNIDSFTVISDSISEPPSILPEAIGEKKIWPCVQWVPEGMAFFVEFYAVQSCSSTRAMIINFGCLYPNALRCQKAECQLPALAAVHSLGFSSGYCLSQKLNRVPGEHSHQMKSSARLLSKKRLKY